MKQDSNAAVSTPHDNTASPEIKSGVPAENAHIYSKRELATYAADFDKTSARHAGELIHSQALRFINLNRDFSARTRSGDALATGAGNGGNPVKRWLSRLRARMVRKLSNLLFKDYFASEAEFNMSLVQFLNDASKYIDERDGALFWELIRKVDYDITSARNRIELIADTQTAELRSTERNLAAQFHAEIRGLSQRMADMESVMEQVSSQIRALDAVVRGMEGLFASGFVTQVKEVETAHAKLSSDVSYVLLENRFRGSEDEIRSRLKLYPPMFTGSSAPILEIGCGRGELLALFKEAQLNAYGVDTDEAMVKLSRAKGLDSRHENGIAHLEALPDGSLGGVIAIQVVEHLAHDVLMRLIRLCARKVQSGGAVIFETINPCSLTALSSNYFRDPSHVFPQHPDTLAFAATLGGLDVKEIRPLSPVPPEARLREVPAAEYMTPRWAELLDLMNNNIKRLNELMFGHQDYCIIAQVR